MVLDDFDDDGLTDIAGIIFSGEFDPRNFSVAFNKGRCLYDLVFHEAALAGPGEGGAIGPLISVKSENGVVGISEEWGSGSSSQLYTYQLHFDKGRFGFLNTTYTDRIPITGAALTHTTDYTNLITSRTVKDMKKSGKEKSMYYNIISNKSEGPIIIDGRKNETEWRKAPSVRIAGKNFVSFGKKRVDNCDDLSFAVESIWKDGFLYFYATVQDGDKVFWEGGNPVNRDHLEIWLDFRPAVDNIENIYEFKPVKRPAKTMTFQWGIVPVRDSKKALAYQLYPKQQTVKNIEAAYIENKNGYAVEIKMPFDINRFKLKWFSRSNNEKIPYCNFTILVSDSDNRKKNRQESIIGSSNFKWGSPFNMGIIYLYENYTTPVFPQFGFK